MGFVSRTTLAVVFAGAIGMGFTAPKAEAQYFGRNKVQYESFDFEVLKTEHFDIYYYDEVQVELAALMAERWYARLSRLLDHDLSGRQALIIYAAHPHFQQSNALMGSMDESTQGATELLKRRIVLPFLGPLSETDHVIGHELVHAFQFDITGEGGGTLVSGVPGAARMPLWFVEGMAEYLSVGHIDPQTAMWMRSLVSQPVSVGAALESQPYQYGQSIWAYIAGRWGDDVVGRLLKAVRATPSAGVALQRVLRVNPDSLVMAWQDEARRHAEPLVSQTENPMGFAEPAGAGQTGQSRNGWPYGQPILGQATGSGRYNIAPSLSPDGGKVIYLSEKDLFAIEMFMADAHSGKVERKIVKSAVDPHFEGLQFVHSAGAWDATGTRFAFAAVRKGQPALSIIDPNTGRKVHEKVFRELGEILNPSWAPDGQSVVFSAIVSGFSDLYTYDVEEETLTRLTNDKFGDIHPAWSPDGNSIAFVTERFTTSLSSLMHGPQRLALMDPRTGAIREVRAFNEGKHTNPQWSPDGRSLYFVSDQNGISNVYRMDLTSGDLYQVTNLFTGVAGISPLSPALSVASGTGEMAVSVHRGAAIDIYRIDDPVALAGGPVITSFEDVEPEILVPVDRRASEVVALIDNPFFGLPRDTAFATVDYKPGLGLDYISQPSLVVGVDRYGTYIGGGASLFWSDMLGGHSLATMFQINGGIKDISAAVAYTNMNRRLNWGVTLQQTSYLTGFYNAGQIENPETGEVFFVEQFVKRRQIYRELSGLLAYPLSSVQRLEFSAGARNIMYDFEVQEDIISVTGEIVDRQKRDLESPDPLNLADASAALVYDNSFYGIASPILGQRYRIEVAPTFGSLNFVTGLFDFRKYIMPKRPFTIAARLMSYGRYGNDAEDLKLQPISIGFPGLVRGYDINSFSSFECGLGFCEAYEQILGSKMIVANLELRFPPLGVLGLGDGFFGFLPLEMAFFVDGGLAWGSDDFRGFDTPGYNEDAWFLGGDRKPVWSTGVSARFNMFNYFILAVDWVKPFQRPDKGWYLQFNMVPGF